MESEKQVAEPQAGTVAAPANEPAPLASAKALGAAPEVATGSYVKLVFLVAFPFYLIHMGVLTRVQGAVLVVAAFVIFRLHLWQIRSEHEAEKKKQQVKKDK